MISSIKIKQDVDDNTYLDVVCKDFARTAFQFQAKKEAYTTYELIQQLRHRYFSSKNTVPGVSLTQDLTPYLYAPIQELRRQGLISRNDCRKKFN